MYWNAVNNAAFCFMSKFKYPAGMIYMSRKFYNSLENEMYGDQWWFLIKENSVRGMKIVIDDSQELFSIRGHGDDVIVITSLDVNRFSQF